MDQRQNKKVFKLCGLTDKQKDFLQQYGQSVLGTRSRTKVILALIDDAMLASGKNQKTTSQAELITENQISKIKKRIQISLPEHTYNHLAKLAENSDSSIQHYITTLIANNIYSEKTKLLGEEITQLKKSNYELHKIGVNINQIAKALNSDEKIDFDLKSAYSFIKQHIDKVKFILKLNS